MSALKNVIGRVIGPTLKSKLKRALSINEVDEAAIILELFSRQGTIGVLVDVGAHHGFELELFVNRGWRCLAFEPDNGNRAVLESKFGEHPSVDIDVRALGKDIVAEQSFYGSNVSTGISGLSAFHESHEETQIVEVTTLNQALENYGITNVGFLKIDVEGFDFFVLQGLDFDRISPSVIVCEYENKKTLPIGYSVNDLIGFLESKGYWVAISEWHPIKEYGTKHHWKGFTENAKSLDPNGWGNLMATNNLTLATSLAKLLKLPSSEFRPLITPTSQ